MIIQLERWKIALGLASAVFTLSACNDGTDPSITGTPFLEFNGETARVLGNDQGLSGDSSGGFEFPVTNTDMDDDMAAAGITVTPIADDALPPPAAAAGRDTPPPPADNGTPSDNGPVADNGGTPTDPSPSPAPAPQEPPAPSTPDALLTLHWPPNPEPEVNAYEIYYGSDKTSTDNLLVNTVNYAGFDLNNPRVQTTLSELPGVTAGRICFRVRAYSNTDSSPKSRAVCATVS